MKKYIFLVLVMTIGLFSCGDDDKPVIPKLNKLTNIVCKKNGDQNPFFLVSINYTSESEISTIRFDKGDNLSFVYLGNKFKVTNLNNVDETAEYVMSGHVITEMSASKTNPYTNNEVYVSDSYNYKYYKSMLVNATWTTRWPKESGGYEERTYNEGEIYTWTNGNITLFTRDKNEMKYEYGTQIAPGNFPLRVIPSFEPIGYEALSPINLMFGAQSLNLPTRAYSYNVLNAGEVIAEYSYSFTVIGDYVTGMVIREKINPVGGKTAEENTYEYSFIYNYAVSS